MKDNSGFLSLLGAAFILGTFGVWIRILDQSFGATVQVIARSAVALGVISLIILWKRKSIRFQIDRKYWKYLLGFGIAFPLSIICFTVSATQMKVTNSLFMLYVGSLISGYLWGRFSFKEKIDSKKLVSIFLLLIGLYVFVYPFSIDKLDTAVLLGLAAGALEGSAHAFRKFMKGLPREIIVFFQSLSAVIVAFVLTVVSGQALVKQIDLVTILVALIFGSLLVAIGYLLAYGFAHYDVNVGSIILATELFFAAVINYIFLKEVPSTYELVGGLIIFMGAVITSIEGNPLSRIRKVLTKKD